MGWDPRWHGQSHTQCGPCVTLCHQTTEICKKREVLRASKEKNKTGKESDIGLLMGGQLMHIGMF